MCPGVSLGIPPVGRWWLLHHSVCRGCSKVSFAELEPLSSLIADLGSRSVLVLHLSSLEHTESANPTALESLADGIIFD